MSEGDRLAVVVLLVDDQRVIGMAVSRLLAGERDIDFHHCADATEAVAAANLLRPTIILQDLVMPQIDGLTLVAQFRANPTTATTPIIVLSASDDADARARAQAAGASDYLVKVPAKDDLIRCLRAHAPSGRADQAPGRIEGDAADVARSEMTLDPDVMAAFRQSGSDGSSEFTLRLIDQFVKEAEVRVGSLRDAAARGDTVALRSTAHALKGSSLVMGVTRLAALCSEVERQPQQHIGSEMVAAIERELAAVRAAFAAEETAIRATELTRGLKGLTQGPTQALRQAGT
jgi:CheY-like chemotaxis protein